MTLANCDGIEPDHCKNVRISNCTLKGSRGISLQGLKVTVEPEMNAYIKEIYLFLSKHFTSANTAG